MNPSYDSPFGSQNPGGQTGMPGGMFPNGQMPNNQVPNNQILNNQMPNGQMPNNQVLNNQMSTPNGYFPNQPTVSSSSQGDIILNPGKPDKKLPVILAIVVALIAIVAIVIMSIVNLNKPSASPTGVSTDVKAAFSRFANFITTGTEGDTFPTEEYDSSTYYSLNNAISDHDYNYIEKANQLFDDFAKGIDSDSDTPISSMINDYKTTWKIIYNYGKKSFYDEEEFINFYVTSNKEDINNLIELDYQNLSSAEETQDKKTAKAFFDFEKYLLNYVSLIEQSGCIENNQIKESCVDSIELSSEQLQRRNDTLTGKNEADQTMDARIYFFIQDLWTIAEVLNEE